ncbi:hypothetical protein COT94_00095 [Candidatus Falkowbacteria bacterium CG10_big_fil_rev_8_21_14_0_10_37_14]|uniref:Uncharacterized protein n=1 Tax=Candidatus Falkowbacteria bacterium CG10_big_fil_rev_8_21_14_0_10_37_14 TaxID=1974561 RepID=A0A2M6WUL6_9BACT|nr:MAG: hypothetical protein COT94_00095 [Candidatus Falkowbacteria bacterium CG10_big_fil_rev_8_21_14_0_10_37_14]
MKIWRHFFINIFFLFNIYSYLYNMKTIIKPENLRFLFREKNNNGAEFTVKSLKTNKDYTFKISRSLWNEKWYTHVKVEQGYQDYKRLGTFADGQITDKKQVVDTPAAKAIAWVLRQISGGDYSKLNNNVEIMHTGACLVCGKKLTDAESIEHGIGPVCRS